MADTELPVYLGVSAPLPRALRERQGSRSGVTFELCEGCWGPYLTGHLDDHLRVVPHRQPPTDTTEG